MDRTDHIRLMARYNQWMNDKVYDVAATLSPAELALDRKAFFGSIIGTLNHLVIADTAWFKRFATHPAAFAALDGIRALPQPVSLDQTLFADLAGLRERRQFIDRCILAFADEVTEPTLDHALEYRNMKGLPMRKHFFSLLMTVFNHQTHHRGQTTTLLSQAGLDVGVTDLLALIADSD